MAKKSFDAALSRALAHVAETERELERQVRYGIAADYPPSLRELLGHEGGYDNDPDDPGGTTDPITGMVGTITTAYVGGRSIEKAARIFKR